MAEEIPRRCGALNYLEEGRARAVLLAVAGLENRRRGYYVQSEERPSRVQVGLGLWPVHRLQNFKTARLGGAFNARSTDE